MHVLIYIAGFVLWPALFGAVAARLLGIKAGFIRGGLCGLAGVGVGSAMSSAVTGGVRGSLNLVTYITFAVLGTLAAIAVLDFVIRPAAVERFQRPLGPIPHPIRAARRRVVRGRRYTSIVLIVRRHRLVPALKRRGHAVPVEHAAARERLFGRQLSQALQEAGGMFIKLGQVLSTRPDLVGEGAADQLSVLQDRAAPADQPAVFQVLQGELGRPPEEVFESFEARPLAAASIGQVHRARLRNGAEVVVKLQRPRIDELVERDLDIILTLAHRIDATGVLGRRLRAADLAQGFAENLRQELDYTLEARNTHVMGELLHQAGIRVPRVFPQYSTRRMLVLEFIDGTPLRDAADAILAQSPGGRTGLARRLLESFLTQVLQAGVVNADPHPGNILVLDDGTLTQIDFGSVVRLHAPQRLSLARLLTAISKQDPDLLRDALLELTTPVPGYDLDALDRALAGLLTERLGAGERPGAGLLGDLLILLSQHGLTFDPQLAGIFRAFMTLEGTLRVLAPGFQILDEAKQLAGKASLRAFGPDAFARAAGEDLFKLAPLLRRLPARLDRITSAMERNEYGYNVRLLAHDDDRRFIQRFFARAMIAFLSSAIGLISALLLSVDHGVALTKSLTLTQALGYAGLITATVLGMRVLVAISRDRVI